MDKALFRYHMEKNKDKVVTIAEALGVTTGVIYAKLRGETAFTLEQVRFFKKRWGLSAGDTSKIFLI